MGWIVQEYATRLYYGASMDSDKSYIVIEKGYGIWVMFYDLNIVGCSLLDVLELPSSIAVDSDISQYVRDMEYPAEVAIQELLLPLIVCEVNLVDTLADTITYIIEYSGNRRNFYRYHWLGED